MNQIAYPPVQEAMEKLKTLSSDEKTRRMAFVRERALRDEISQLSAAKQEGIEIGVQKGRAEGRAEGKTEHFATAART